MVRKLDDSLFALVSSGAVNSTDLSSDSGGGGGGGSGEEFDVPDGAKSYEYTDGLLTSVTTVAGEVTWTEIMNYANGQLMSASISNGTDTWTKTIEYLNGQVSGDSGWVKA